MSDASVVRLRNDERGAIMVFGIFMCSMLVGLLWYVAGLGDAIIYRERMQEAADAVAFSDAALHARGMNLVVLLNLVMAAVLAIRVAIRVAKAGCALLTVTFIGLSIPNPGFAPVATALGNATRVMHQVDKTTTPPIDKTLKGLVAVQSAVATAVPTYAHLVSSLSVGGKYDVRALPLSGAGEVLSQLPVERRRPDKLCKEAGRATGKLWQWLLDKVALGAFGAGTDIITEALGSIAGSSPSYFCGLEPGAAPPDISTRFDEDAENARCKDIIDKGGKGENKRWESADKAWLSKCSELGVSCQSRDANGGTLPLGVQQGQPSDAESKDELERLKLQRDLEARNMVFLTTTKVYIPMDPRTCKDWVKADTKERRKAAADLAAKQAGASPAGGTSSASQGVAPMLTKGIRNGSEEGQIFAIAQRNDDHWKYSASLVRIADVSSKSKKPSKPDESSIPSVAQSEFFYDCSGSWSAEDCNKDDESMWHFQWRARLRRVNRNPAAKTLVTVVTAAGLGSLKTHELFVTELAARALLTVSTREMPWNAPLRGELMEIVNHENTRKYGVH